ncbi:MAG: SIMPL domain-containing protein [Actinobacteria bacterium]|nr:SIMPL domain-containing protein [Actinomycetota bacterium]
MDGGGKVGVAALVLGVALGLSLPGAAQDTSSEPAKRTVSVSGIGRVTRAPDEALVSLGVRTEAADPAEAMNQNARRMNAVLSALTDAGVDREDIATTNVSLYPNWENESGTPSGYVAENQIEVTVTDLERIGKVLDVAVEAGANIAGGISFRLSDDNVGREEALRGAVADARDKAEILAAATGATLGRVVTIQEAGGGTPPPVYYEDRAYAVAEGAAAPVIPPELDSMVSVLVVWELV